MDNTKEEQLEEEKEMTEEDFIYNYEQMKSTPVMVDMSTSNILQLQYPTLVITDPMHYLLFYFFCILLCV